jgi:hypothetical protein
MSLFQESIIRKYLDYLDQEVVEQAYLRFKKVYSANKISNIKIANEEQYQEGFIKDIFGEVLGYSVFPDQPFNIQTEKKNEANSKKADGAIFKGENVVGVIELKDNKTKNLDAVKDQAFGYKNNHKECSYVISSNFHKLRFYVDDATDYEEFDLYNLDKETFKRFYLYLHKEGLLDKNIPKLLRNETKFHEENITKSLYKDYSSFKNSFFQNVVKNNPQYDKLLLFKKSQKFLDKVLFVLFAEDKGLVSTNSIVQIVEKWNNLKNDAFDTPKPLYQLIALFFSNLFIGKKDQKGGVLIPEFGGEIFAPDEVLDTLLVDDEVLQDDLLKLSKYDFNTDVDVNILGHIFEHSLSEIEEVEASLKGEVADKTKGKRKKDGVFYTPKYITKYIVENTIGTLCAEKKTELKLDRDIAIFEYQKADGKLNAKGIELFTTLNQYKDWLLTLKILDPACGSGAFLNQAVNFLVQEHAFVDDIIAELTNSPLRLFDTDIAILENNIYGVDINEESIEIAKLSLWLRTAKQGRKLSNLSNNIKCGNSLIDDPAIAGDKAFNWQNEFPEVFAKGGFDVVIGNPPYINIYNMNSLDRDYFNLSDDYTTTYLKYDIYVLFIEKAINLLKKNGIMSYIIPSVILSIPYGKIIREKIIKENTLNQIIDFTGFKVFSDAMVESCILLISKNTSENNFVKIFKPKLIVTDFQSDNILINQNEFLKTDSFQFRLELNNNSLLIIDKIKKLSVSLESIYYVSKGIVAFSKIDDRKKDDFIFNEKIDEKCYPYLEGKDVNRYYIGFENKYLQYDVNIMSRPTFPELHNKNKLLIRAISDGLNATYDDNGYYIDQKLIICSKRFEIENYIIPSKRPKSEHLDSKNVINDLAILALLNSKLSSFYYNKMYKGGVSILPEDVRNFTIYLFKTKEDQQPFVDKADSMLSLNKELQELTQKFQRSLERKFALTELPKKLQDWYLLSYAEFIKELEKKKIKLSLSEEAEWETYFTSEAKKALDLKTHIEKTDKEIDQMVYALYELTEDEIKIVEES